MRNADLQTKLLVSQHYFINNIFFHVEMYKIIDIYQNNTLALK